MSDDSPPNNPFGDMPFFGGMGGMGDLSSLFGGDPWASARQIAASVANQGGSENNIDPSERIAFEQLARVAELHVNGKTGLSVAEGSPPLIRPATRHEWAQATIDAWRPLFESMSTAMSQSMSTDLDLPEDLSLIHI